MRSSVNERTNLMATGVPDEILEPEEDTTIVRSGKITRSKSKGEGGVSARRWIERLWSRNRSDTKEGRLWFEEGAVSREAGRWIADLQRRHRRSPRRSFSLPDSGFLRCHEMLRIGRDGKKRRRRREGWS